MDPRSSGPQGERPDEPRRDLADNAQPFVGDTARDPPPGAPPTGVNGQQTRDALGQLMQRYEPMVHAILRKFDVDDVIDDLRQEVFTKLWQAQPHFTSDDHFVACLRTAARWVAIDYCKKRARRSIEVSLADWEAAQAARDESADAQDLRAELRSRMEKNLEPEELQLLCERFLPEVGEPPSPSELAEKYDVDPATVWRRIHRALEKLRAPCADLYYQ